MKKKMKRRSVALIMAVVMVLALAACGKTEEPETDPDTGKHPSLKDRRW